jgi:Holliday junction resolvase RusA-like endonuclease
MVDLTVCRFEMRSIVEGKKQQATRIAETHTGKQFVHVYKTGATRRYEARIGQEAALAMGNRPPVACAVSVDVLAYLPVPQSWSKKKRAAALAGQVRPTSKPDWENIGKALDGVKGIVWVDDKQVVDGRVRKFYSDIPKLIVTVSLVDGVSDGN